MLRNSFTLLFIFIGQISIGQVHIVSPQKNGILQVRGNHADLRLKMIVPSSYENFRIKLSSDKDTSSPLTGTTPMTPTNGLIDTVLTVPKSLRDYTVWWFADSNGASESGWISGLTPGHIIGVAGQSNAVGEDWEPLVNAEGDIRMLIGDSSWTPAKEPTAGSGAGPWIEMANELYAEIGDGLPVGIVNTAVGGSGLVFFALYGGWWHRNAEFAEDTSTYGKAVHRLRETGGELECLCWIQGETEASYWPYVSAPQVYRDSFASMMSGLKSDLNDSFAIYHLQVGGWTGTNAPDYPIVHQAQLSLPGSTLVGTALGRAVQSDGVHYTGETYKAVGRMFAGAILRERYGITASMYPPLLPDTNAIFDSVLDGSIPGRYCISMSFRRGGAPVVLHAVTPLEYFALLEDGVLLDTSQIWFRISSDSNRVLVGLRNEAMTLDHSWQVTYNATPGADEAPIATFDPISGDTIFAAAFDTLPVLPSRIYDSGVGNDDSSSKIISEIVYDVRGVAVQQNERGTASTIGLLPGVYWVIRKFENGNRDIQKILLAP